MYGRLRRSVSIWLSSDAFGSITCSLFRCPSRGDLPLFLMFAVFRGIDALDLCVFFLLDLLYFPSWRELLDYPRLEIAD